MKNVQKNLNKIGVCDIDFLNIKGIEHEEYNYLKEKYLSKDSGWKFLGKESLVEYTDGVLKIVQYQMNILNKRDLAQKTLGNMFFVLAESEKDGVIEIKNKDKVMGYYIASLYFYNLHRENTNYDFDLEHFENILSSFFNFIFHNFNILSDLDASINISVIIDDFFQKNLSKKQNTIIEQIGKFLETQYEKIYKISFYFYVYKKYDRKVVRDYFYHLFENNKKDFEQIPDFYLIQTVLFLGKYQNEVLGKDDLELTYRRDLEIIDHLEATGRYSLFEEVSSSYLKIYYRLSLGYIERSLGEDVDFILKKVKKSLKLYKRGLSIKNEELKKINDEMIAFKLQSIYIKILEFAKKYEERIMDTFFRFIKTELRNNHFSLISEQDQSNYVRWHYNYIWLIHLYTRHTLRADEIEQLFSIFSFIYDNPRRGIVSLYNIVITKHFSARLDMEDKYNLMDRDELDKVFWSLLIQEELKLNRKYTEDESNIIELLSDYESMKLEFKSSFSVNIHKLIQKKYKKIEGNSNFYGPYLESIVAFLNAEGGKLVIGVWEKKALDLLKRKKNLNEEDINFDLLREHEEIPGKYVLGLEYDMKFKDFDEEGIQKRFDQVLEKYLTESPQSLGLNIICKIVDFDGIKIAVIDVPKSNKPVFLYSQNRQEENFLIRKNGQSQSLKGQELANYIRKHFSS